MRRASPLVSVIVPCYDYGRFLGEAIESVLAQRHPRVEVIVVDDGSSDDTPAVAARYTARSTAVRYLRQENAGLSAARNAGFHLSAGEYVAFLDADDRLLPHAVEAGLTELAADPACGFAAGSYRYIDERGSVLDEPPAPHVASDHYAELLTRNYLPTTALVLYRRSALSELAGPFDPAVPACADYELMLRVAGRHPVRTYREVIADYRRHDGSMTRDPALILRTALRVLRDHRPLLGGDARLLAACDRGARFFADYYAAQLYFETCVALRGGRLRRATRTALTLFRYAPLTGLRLAARGVLT